MFQYQELMIWKDINVNISIRKTIIKSCNQTSFQPWKMFHKFGLSWVKKIIQVFKKLCFLHKN